MKPAGAPEADLPAPPKSGLINWSSLTGLVYSVAVFFGSQLVVGFVLSAVVIALGGDHQATIDRLNSSVTVEFLSILAVESITVLGIVAFLRRRKTGLNFIGLDRPKLTYIAYALAAFGAYLPIYIVVLTLAHNLFPQINVDQHQQLAFGSSTSGFGLVLVFISLVVLPPIAEEILCRGFLYTSLKKNLPKVVAALGTSVLFATAHLQFGSGRPLLWVAAIDTFVLSMVLVYVREKTGSLWPGILLHAIKNAIAFASLFIFHLS